MKFPKWPFFLILVVVIILILAACGESETKMNEGCQDIGRVKLDRKVYLLGTLGSLGKDGEIYYNKTMFELEGLEDPYELQQKSEWIWETLLNETRELATGDQYGLSAEPFNIGGRPILSNDAQFLDIEAGEIKLDDPDTMETLEFMADLYHVHDVIKPNDRSNDWEEPPAQAVPQIKPEEQG